MSNELAERQETSLAETSTSSSGLVAMMERLALNPDIPTDKLRELLDMQKEIISMEAEREFSEAMARVQAAIPTVVRDKENTQTNSMYSRHETISRIIKPIYTAEGFSIVFSEAESPKDNHVRVVATVRHKAGHSEKHWRDVAVDSTGIKGNVNKTLTHAEASAFQYGRRYLTCAIFDVATGDDDDGNAAGASPRVTDEQIEQIEQKIDETKANRAAFLRWAKVDEPSQILEKNFQAVMDQLDSVAKAKSKKS